MNLLGKHMEGTLRNTLTIFSDGERMRRLFQQRLPVYAQGSLVITRCQVLRSQYRPDLNGDSPRKHVFSASYELEVLDPATQYAGVQRLYAKVYPEFCSKEEFIKNKSLEVISPDFGDPLVHIHDLEMIVWAFPNDKKLTQLPELIDPERVTTHLPYDPLPEGLDGPEDLLKVSVDVVRYKPDDRCTLRYELRYGDTQSPQELTLYGKTFKDDRGQSIFEAIKVLWEEAEKNPNALMVAQPYGYSRRVKMIWQKALPGKPLIAELNQGNHKSLLLSVAMGLASLHKLELAGEEGPDLGRQLAMIKQQMSELTRALPQLSKPLKMIEVNLEDSLRGMDKEICLKSVHGDFRIRELIVSGDRLGVFDFDDVFIGDPVQDLALFLVSLHWQYHDSNLLQSMAGTFYQSYQSQVDWTVPLDRLDWYVRIHFIKKAFWYYKVKRFDPDLEKKVRSIISLAQKRFEVV